MPPAETFSSLAEPERMLTEWGGEHYSARERIVGGLPERGWRMSARALSRYLPRFSEAQSPTCVMAAQVDRGELAGPAIAFHVGGVALAGWAVAACARRLDDHCLVRPELHATRLRGQLRQCTVRVVQLEPPPEPGLAAEDAPWRQTK